MESLTMEPAEIEVESFKMIDSEAGIHPYSEMEWSVVRRIIHTTADFDYKDSMFFSENAVSKAISAIRDGADINTDTTMIVSGINKTRLAEFKCNLSCYIADKDVASMAEQNQITRCIAAMRKAVNHSPQGIFVVGNSPAALFELLRLIDTGMCNPALIIGLPVGFVGASESKEALVESYNEGVFCPIITNTGRKGGSNIAAAVLNSIMKLAM